MDSVEVDKIKKLAVISMFTDDELMEKLVLKGGNAMNMIYNIKGNRASKDLDFSINDDFTQGELSILNNKINKILKETFKADGFYVFDINFGLRPKEMDEERKSFWGGYRIEFKTILFDKYIEFKGNLKEIRKRAITVTDNKSTIFEIDISKFEYTASKVEKEFDKYTIYVYTPEMLAFEKLRAICQQCKEYGNIIKSKRQSARARDFYDIYLILDYFMFDVCKNDKIELIKLIFEAKRVPLEFIGLIKNYREFHKADFQSVIDTVTPDIHLKDFDYYFDYVLNKFKCLEIFWKK